MSILTVTKQDQDCAIRILDNCGGNWQSISKEIAKYRAEREAQVRAEEREKVAGLVEALDNILCMHDGNQSPAMNMPDINYARFVIQQIHNESRDALATYNDNRKG